MHPSKLGTRSFESEDDNLIFTVLSYFCRSQKLQIFIFRGKGELPGESKPIVTMKKYGDKLKKQLQQDGSSFEKNSETILRRPRYVRINVLLASKKEVQLLMPQELTNSFKSRSSLFYD